MAEPAPTRSHPGLTISIAAGAIGVLLLLTGMLLGSDGVLISGVVLGAISLLAALVWRADLVASWRSGDRPG